MSFLRSKLELPLLKREMIESAQKKRIYILRSICLVIFGLVFLSSYLNATNTADNVARVLGSGREMSMALWASCLVAIYALAPAMACSAISSEMEKQTMGILLISKLTPGKIVVEKIFSRMLPLVSLIVVVCPLFAVSFMFGGLSFGQTMMGVYLLLFVVFHVTSIAVLCSAAFRSGVVAFWMTYVILFVWYFAWPLLTEATDLRFGRSWGLPEPEFVFFPVYQADMLLTAASSWKEIGYVVVPPLFVTLMFPIAAWWFLSGYVEGESASVAELVNRGSASFVTGLRKYEFGRLIARKAAWMPAFGARCMQLGRDLRESLATFVRGTPLESFVARQDTKTDDQSSSSTEVPDEAIAWREQRTGMFAKYPVMTVGVPGLLFVEWLLLPANGWRGRADEYCALFSFGALIVCLLLVLGQSCRKFAKERERQTLSVLLVSPITNQVLLDHKLASVNSVIRKGILLILVPTTFNILWTNFDQSSRLVYLICTIGNGYIYMHLVKWTGTYFGLRTNTQMKAMVSSLVAILILCFVPLLLWLVCLLGMGSRPPDSTLFLFSSPMPVAVLNEFHKLWRVSTRTSLPGSELLIVVINFLVYGWIVCMIKRRTIRELPELLERIDGE